MIHKYLIRVKNPCRRPNPVKISKALPQVQQLGRDGPAVAASMMPRASMFGPWSFLPFRCCCGKDPSLSMW